ncbi:MAG TPA: hypothetical protein VIX59_15970 [Candidatus Binataceae bacterium]
MRTKLSLAAMAALILGLTAAPVLAGITANILSGPYELRLAGFDVDADTQSAGTLAVTGVIVFDGVDTVISADLNVGGEDFTVSNFSCHPGAFTSGNYLLDASHDIAAVTLTYPSGDPCFSGDTIEFDVAIGSSLGATHQVSSGPFSTTRTLDNPCTFTDELSLNNPGGSFGTKQRPVCMTSVVLDGEMVHQ